MLGKTLVCPCSEPKTKCHAESILAGVNVLLQKKVEERNQETEIEDDEPPGLCDDSDEEEWDQSENVSRSLLWAANETLGMPAPQAIRKPSWPASCHCLISQIRAATTLIF